MKISLICRKWGWDKVEELVQTAAILPTAWSLTASTLATQLNISIGQGFRCRVKLTRERFRMYRTGRNSSGAGSWPWLELINFPLNHTGPDLLSRSGLLRGLQEFTGCQGSHTHIQRDSVDIDVVPWL